MTTQLQLINNIIIIIISFMQGIYTHIPETNYVPREYGVAAILLFLFMVIIIIIIIIIIRDTLYMFWIIPVSQVPLHLYLE